MSSPTPAEILKMHPDVYGHVIKKERKEHIIIKGVPLEIKKYTTASKKKGIRLSLLENAHPLIIKFNEFLASISDLRPTDERAMNMWSFTTLCNAEPGLEKIEGAGFYVYQNHVIFNEEEKSLPPMDRLIIFVDYFKKKFNIKTRIKEDEFSELDVLERSEQE